MTKKIVFFIALLFNYVITESSYRSEDEFNNYLISFFRRKENKKEKDSLETRSTYNKETDSNQISTSNNKISEEEFFSQLLENYNQKTITKEKEKTSCTVPTDNQIALATHQVIERKKTLPDNDCWLLARLGSSYKYRTILTAPPVKNISFATNPSTIATPLYVDPYQKNSSQTLEGYEK